MRSMTPKQVIDLLQLQPHPEGGHFCETFRDNGNASTAIYYLLQAEERSHWHRVHGASEVWHHYAGAPLRLMQSRNGQDCSSALLGKDLGNGETPQIIVPAGWWQSAESLGEWTLTGCTVAPGFQFENFEMAPPGWKPVHSDTVGKSSAG